MNGLERTRVAVRTHLAAVAWPRYEVRLIDAACHTCRATRYWTAPQLLAGDTLRFLRIRNREGCEVYFRPHAGALCAGYLLLDFDHGPCPRTALQAAQHTPCAIVQTSPGRQQAWLRVCPHALSPALATSVARELARRYGSDPACADWRHMGRLAGFTNRKPVRRQNNGLAPWVRVVWQCAGVLATVDDLIVGTSALPLPAVAPGSLPTHATSLYQHALYAMGLLQRFPQPDWSIADYRVARWLFEQGYDAACVAATLQRGSPGFPRRHSQPDDYLNRTLRAAARGLPGNSGFSRAPDPPRS